MTWWIYPVYFLDLGLMIFLSILLGNLVDMLDKKTKISGAFIGGVLLAAVTSLPELFTALSAIFIVNEPELVVGDLLGSIVFDLVCLALETMIFIKGFRNSKVNKFHLINGVVCFVMYLLAAYAFFAPVENQIMLGDINLMSIFIFILYIVTLIIQPKESEKEDDNIEIKWSLKKIVTLFIISSLLLIGSSIALTQLTSMIQKDIPALSGSVAGALLLGIGTSLPEIISTFQLYKRKNYDAAIGNMLGSCTFDFAIFAFSDFLTWHQVNNKTDSEGNFIISLRGIFINTKDSINFEIFGCIISFLVVTLLSFKVFTKLFEKSKAFSYITSILIGLGSLAMYIVIYCLPNALI